jgi:hypothetical protein
MTRTIHFIIIITSILLTTNCSKEFDNPNVTEDELLKTPEGIVQLIVGTKHRFAVNSNFGNGAVFTSRSANALSTFEVVQRAGANQDLNQLSLGGRGLAPNNQIITTLWGNCMVINRITTLILDRAPAVITDTNVLFQVQRYALLYKAMALGTLALYWQEFPVTIGENQPFVTRKDGLLAAIDLLNLANATRETTSLYSSVLGTEINLRNSINAISARCYLMLGFFEDQYNEMARQKASGVQLNSRSVFTYNALNPNPIFRNGFTGYDPNEHLGLPSQLKPAVNDLRVSYYKLVKGAQPPRFSRTDTSSIPLYLPGEMMLIQAEVWARKGDAQSLDSSKKYLDMVLTKTPVADVFGIGAALPPYAGPMTKEALLTEVYRNRCIELFMSGLKLEDSRRFERPAAGTPNEERNRNFYPYPLQERYGNPNTPPKDPD